MTNISFTTLANKKFASYDRSGSLCGCAGLFGINKHRTYLKRTDKNKLSEFEKWQTKLQKSKSDSDVYYELLVIQYSLRTTGALSNIVNQLLERDGSNGGCSAKDKNNAQKRFECYLSRERAQNKIRDRKSLIQKSIQDASGEVDVDTVISLMSYLCIEHTSILGQSGARLGPPSRQELAQFDKKGKIDLIHNKFCQVSSLITQLTANGNKLNKTLDDGTNKEITDESFEQDFQRKLAKKINAENAIGRKDQPSNTQQVLPGSSPKEIPHKSSTKLRRFSRCFGSL